MINRKTLTISLSPENFQFIKNTAEKEGFHKSSLIGKALDYYRKYTLRKNLIEGFQNQTLRDEKEAMSDFKDYFKIVNS